MFAERAPALQTYVICEYMYSIPFIRIHVSEFATRKDNIWIGSQGTLSIPPCWICIDLEIADQSVWFEKLLRCSHHRNFKLY